jgi:hypothetical protein
VYNIFRPYTAFLRSLSSIWKYKGFCVQVRQCPTSDNATGNTVLNIYVYKSQYALRLQYQDWSVNTASECSQSFQRIIRVHKSALRYFIFLYLTMMPVGLTILFWFKWYLMNNELKSIWKEAVSHTWGTIPTLFFWADNMKPRKTSIRIVGAAAKIRIGYLSNTTIPNPHTDDQLFI